MIVFDRDLILSIRSMLLGSKKKVLFWHFWDTLFMWSNDIVAGHSGQAERNGATFASGDIGGRDSKKGSRH